MMTPAETTSVSISIDVPKGDWNLFHTWLHGSNIVNPAVHIGIAGGGQLAWIGWPDVPQLEKLVADWDLTPAAISPAQPLVEDRV
jgi:hypothetical protein